jgi:hypothetical protein
MKYNEQKEVDIREWYFLYLVLLEAFASSRSVLYGFLWYIILCWYKQSVPKVQKTIHNYLKASSACLSHPHPIQSLEPT